MTPKRRPPVGPTAGRDLVEWIEDMLRTQVMVLGFAISRVDVQEMDGPLAEKFLQPADIYEMASRQWGVILGRVQGNRPVADMSLIYDMYESVIHWTHDYLNRETGLDPKAKEVFLDVYDRSQGKPTKVAINDMEKERLHAWIDARIGEGVQVLPDDRAEWLKPGQMTVSTLAIEAVVNTIQAEHVHAKYKLFIDEAARYIKEKKSHD
jgi:hypothetical protein